MRMVADPLLPNNRHVDSAPRKWSGKAQDIRPDLSAEPPLPQSFLYQKSRDFGRGDWNVGRETLARAHEI